MYLAHHELDSVIISSIIYFIADHRTLVLKCACTSKAIVHLLSNTVLQAEVCSKLACDFILCLEH